MRNMKKRVSVLLVLVMLFALLAVPANALTVEGSKGFISVDEVKDAIKASNGDTIALDFSNIGSVITAVEIPAAAIAMVEETGKTLTVNVGIASLEINQTALSNIATQVGSEGNVLLAVNLNPTMTPAQATASTSAKICFYPDIVYGDRYLEVGEGGSITAKLPEVLVGAMGGDLYTVALLDKEGVFHEVKTEIINGYMVAQLTELGVYALIEKGLVEEPAAPVNPFADVADNAWYLNPVLWAVGEGITGGTSATTFGPDNYCTRAQVVTFLYAAAGKPEVNTAKNPFEDVADNAWYLKPVLWAVENGITGGTSATTFGPDNYCTRAQVVTFLYAAAGKPEVAVDNPFVDIAVSDWYAKPILWAVDKGVTGGTSATTFGPGNKCTRAQVVTFLYADAGKPAIK